MLKYEIELLVIAWPQQAVRESEMTRFDSLRTDPAHWSLRLICYCRQDAGLVKPVLASEPRSETRDDS